MTTAAPRRLAIVVNIPRFFLSHRLPVALAAARDGFEVHVITSDADRAGLERIRSHGLSVHGIRLEQHGRSPSSELRSALAILRRLAALRPDVVHLVTIKPVLYGGVAARLLRIPRTVAALTGLGRMFAEGGDPGRIMTTALRVALAGSRTTLILQNSDDAQRVAALSLARPGSVRLIPGSGVDPDLFAVRAEPTVPVVLHAGRLMRAKGVGEFIEVARRLAGRARFAVAGYSEAGSPDAIPEADLERLDREGIIEWLGNRDDMPEVIAGATIVVLPTSYPEGIPKVLIEAAACGRPTVATDVPGCREICIDGETGLLVPSGDVEALTVAVQRLLDDPGLRAQLGRRGRELVVDRFTLAGVIADTLAAYGDGTAAPQHADRGHGHPGR